jgi:hypothetical protein
VGVTFMGPRAESRQKVLEVCWVVAESVEEVLNLGQEAVSPLRPT